MEVASWLCQDDLDFSLSLKLQPKNYFINKKPKVLLPPSLGIWRKTHYQVTLQPGDLPRSPSRHHYGPVAPGHHCGHADLSPLLPFFNLYFFLLFLYLFICVYIVWATSLLYYQPHSLFPSPPTPLLPGRTCSALLFSNFVEEKT
jgi:hypothetical protein